MLVVHVYEKKNLSRDLWGISENATLSTKKIIELPVEERADGDRSGLLQWLFKFINCVVILGSEEYKCS